MFTRDITDTFFTESLRVDTIIPVELSCHIEDGLTDAFVDEFADWVLDLDHDDAVVLFDHLPGLKEFLVGASCDDAVGLANWLFNKNFDGFLAKVSTPVRRYRADGCYTFGWHYIRYTWVYGETVEQVAERALDWANRLFAGWKAEGGAA